MLAQARAEFREKEYASVLEAIKKRGINLIRSGGTSVRNIHAATFGCLTASPPSTIPVQYGQDANGQDIRLDCSYSMAWVRSTPQEQFEDLALIVAMNVADENIAKANRQSGDSEKDWIDRYITKNIAFYQQWHTKCPHSFLLLREHCHCSTCYDQGETAKGLVVAATVLLPLNLKTEGPLKGKPVIAEHGKQASDLISKDISKLPTDDLLLDTLVTRWGFKNKLGEMPWSMLLQHIHELYPDLMNRNSELTLWVEPDEPSGKYTKCCWRLGERVSTRADVELSTYSLSVTPSFINSRLVDTDISPREIERLVFLKTFFQTIDKMSFPITNNIKNDPPH